MPKPRVGKTETIKERTVYVYLPSLEMVREWKRRAEKAGASISKFEYRIEEDLPGQHSSFDTMTPETGLVLYRVQQTRIGPWWRDPWIEVMSCLSEGENYHAHEGTTTRFTALREFWYLNEYWYPAMIYRVRRGSEGGLVATLFPLGYKEVRIAPVEIRIRPDLDLHAYTFLGEHVGMNYASGEYEVKIPGALASGEYMGSEWIWVPPGVEVYFTVSSRDTWVFLKENLGKGLVWLENENTFFGLQVKYGADGVEYLSLSESYVIPPGKELLCRFQVTLLPDGTYSIEIKPVMDFLELEAWHEAIDKIPDGIFIRNPAQRKRALKEKFKAVFKDIGTGGLRGAIRKLEHDILKKLDADDKADWVSQPVLVEEVRALIGVLRYRERSHSR